MGIVDDLIELFPDTVVMQAMTFDRYGAQTPDGDPVTIPCYVSGKVTMVSDKQGQMRTSTVHATLAGAYGATTTHKFTLPARFTPVEPSVLAVMKSTDEDGAHHETVYFS